MRQIADDDCLPEVNARRRVPWLLRFAYRLMPPRHPAELLVARAAGRWLFWVIETQAVVYASAVICVAGLAAFRPESLVPGELTYHYVSNLMAVSMPVTLALYVVGMGMFVLGIRRLKVARSGRIGRWCPAARRPWTGAWRGWRS